MRIYSDVRDYGGNIVDLLNLHSHKISPKTFPAQTLLLTGNNILQIGKKVLHYPYMPNSKIIIIKQHLDTRCREFQKFGNS